MKFHRVRTRETPQLTIFKSIMKTKKPPIYICSAVVAKIAHNKNDMTERKIY